MASRVSLSLLNSQTLYCLVLGRGGSLAETMILSVFPAPLRKLKLPRFSAAAAERGTIDFGASKRGTKITPAPIADTAPTASRTRTKPTPATVSQGVREAGWVRDVPV